MFADSGRGGLSGAGGVGEPIRGRRALRLLLLGLVRGLSRKRQRGSGGRAWSAAQMLLLALTQEQAGYPYELEQRYECRFGRLLPAAKGSAFRVLPILAEHGYVDGTPLPPRLRGVRVPQVSYKITRAGQEALGLWLRSPLGPLWRTELLARMDATSMLGPKDQGELVARYEREAELEEQELNRQLAELTSEDSSLSLAIIMRRLTLEERLVVLAVQRQWVRTARKQLQQHRPSR
jgi:DNA-binding PadR family transcriptional regulator